ncbi:ATP-binding cassette domain-containing protein [Aerococcaceae bacterium NML210727]|nr:ATP-binding cassette domain-containing protein [Aerococcaceae bacterium NML210727]MCW6653989.1 ATP-binding cassette domain-containing protein [Aerococcaceae bacterium NML201296]MCW6662981.1 ATP-binding cassette domain-containing protein [Aerococcaceae bacterium NML190073]MCW6664905.1 ATP-binding cassette domain-containing protein [Aerococcaceae bacterium NML191219]MCW6666506.1 ATP-binding cassette domain-containing protein [Aerococcaceae bacterium NML190938]MCW6679946.1 ATP-binding cassette
MSTATEYILDIDNIVKEFPGVRALDKAQLKVRPGTVHALMGENGAGKSTMMKCLFGIYIEDEGTIRLNGEQVRFDNPKQALENGVSMVHQELNQVLKRSVMENIWLGRFPMKRGFVDSRKMYEDTKKIFEQLNIDVDPKVLIGKLSVSQRQMVEIAKAVSYDAKVLILDEPTSSLTAQEVRHLFRIINQLKEQGYGIVYISHKMEEILEISDDVTIMRDGRWIATEPASELTMDRIIQLMVGRDLGHLFPPRDNVPGEVSLQLKNLTAKYQPSIKDVSLDIRKGEVLGIAGLVGSRRTELLECIFGTATLESGEIYKDGKLIQNRNSREAIKNGFALVTEERRATGIFPIADIRFNTVIANIGGYTNKFGFVNSSTTESDTQRMIDAMQIKTPTQKTQIRSLSGGNQQKVIIGRWLLTDADVYLFDEPTRGIDVGAKYEIYQLILDLAKRGKTVVVVSSEMMELIGITDRIAVMSNGYLAGVEDTDKLTQEEIMRLSALHL